MPNEQIHFITGRLAEHSLRQVLATLSVDAGFGYSIDVLPITVAALMTPDWIAKHISVPTKAKPTRIVLPGYCKGDLSPVEQATSLPVERGPRDLRSLPHFFNQPCKTNYTGKHSIEIIAEINHCPQLSLKETLAIAKKYALEGADVIDVGCEPGHAWFGVSETVRALREAGHRVSIDSMNPKEIAAATKAGAELVLSVNSTNREAAADWGAEVVVIPDDPKTMLGFEETIELLEARHVPYRLDPVLEPIGFGLAESLARYHKVRRCFPAARIMMGIGNLTELTEVDSAGVNMLLLGYCQELDIQSVLTTEVIPWCRTSVRECAIARQLAYYAMHEKALPKHVDSGLLILRDAELSAPNGQELLLLAGELKDSNIRIYQDENELHLVSKELYLHGPDPFALFKELRAIRQDDEQQTAPDSPKQTTKEITPAHAFYLGYELCKAETARTLGKQYHQDEPLDWGFLSKEEKRERLK